MKNIKKLTIGIIIGLGFILSVQNVLASSLPDVMTVSATPYSTDATLEGAYRSNGAVTQTYFEYATNPGFSGSYTTPYITQSLTTNGGNGKFFANISSLNSNTTYYVRAVAINSFGTSYGLPAISFNTTGNGGGNTSSCSISYFNASQYSVIAGNSVSLNWVTNNCTNVSISNIGPVSNSNTNYPVFPQNTTTYVLNASNAYGSVSSQLTIVVNSYNPPSNYCTINYFNANQYSVSSGTPVTLSWSTNNCVSVFISNIGSLYNSTNTYVVYPQTTSVYTLSAFGNNGTPSSSVTITVNGNSNNQRYLPNAVTTVVSSLKSTSAVLHGTIYTNGTIPTYAYFEYGTSPSFGLSTGKYSFSSSSSDFVKSISGMTPSTTYYFRAVAENSNGISKGDTFYFTTPSAGYNVETPTIVKYSSGSNSFNSNSQNSSNQNVSNNLGASAGSASVSFLPSTAIGWMLMIIFVLILLIIIRALINKETQNNHLR